MNETIKTIMARRAIRRFDEARQLEEDVLSQILDAGLCAPSAGGRQGVIFVVCQDKEVNAQLGRIKRAASRPSMATATSCVSREQPSIADDATIDDAFYGAPVVITMFAPKGFLFSAEDCAVAAENMMLAATSLGVGSCYVGQGRAAFADPCGKEILRKWGVRTDYYAVMQLLLGYPRAGDPPPQRKPRREGRVIRMAPDGSVTAQ